MRDERGREGDDKEEYLKMIRDQEKDLDFYKGICGMMLKDSEMYKLKEKVKFDFETNKWKVPPFIVKAKEVAFPQLG